MGTDIFHFWEQIAPDARTHPADDSVLGRMPSHGFEVEHALPGCFMGPLRTAPIVLLFLSPGLDDGDMPTPALINWHVRNRSGLEPLISKEVHAPAYRWWTQRSQFLGTADELADKLAVLNIGAYHSKTFNDHGLLAALPSSRASLDWAQNVLFPDAESGKRVVICLRAAKYWGLESGVKYPGTLFAPKVTRGGHTLKEGRDEIVAAVQKILGS